jgi:hypothetical protein
MAATSFIGSILERMTRSAPVREHREHDVDLLALEDLAQPLLVEPGARGAHRARVVGNERVRIGGCLWPGG